MQYVFHVGVGAGEEGRCLGKCCVFSMLGDVVWFWAHNVDLWEE